MAKVQGTFGVAPPTTLPAMEALYRDFPLVKNASKYFRVGIDTKMFKPFISLVKQPYKECINFTQSEFKHLTSDEINNFVHFSAQVNMEPIKVGTLSVSLKVIGNCTVMCIEKDNCRVYLAESTWKFVHRIKEILFNYLSQCKAVCVEASSSFNYLMNHAKYFCLPRWGGNSAKIPDLNEEEWFDLLSKAFDVTSIPFPESLKQEMLCYQTDYLKETLISMIKQ